MIKLKSIIITLFIFTNLFLFSEKWVGKAATYQKKPGLKTASGIEFNENSEFAACNAFKLGTVVKIRNTANDKMIETIINDRIDKNLDYFILLTPKAAKELGIEWQTAIVIVEASFSDIETEQKLEITGLIPENKIDKEILKKFPDIQFKFSQQEESKAIKERKDERNEIIKKEELLLKHQPVSMYKQEKIEKEIKLDSDEKIKISFLSPKTEIEKQITKPLEKEEQKIHLSDEFVIKETTKQALEKKEIVKEIVKEIKKTIETISWDKKLMPNKNYIRLSTAFDQKEAERRIILFKEIFKNLVWIKVEEKYILLIGPIDKKDLDKELDFIRSLGFIDAYIVKGN